MSLLVLGNFIESEELRVKNFVGKASLLGNFSESEELCDESVSSRKLQ